MDLKLADQMASSFNRTDYINCFCVDDGKKNIPT